MNGLARRKSQKKTQRKRSTAKKASVKAKNSPQRSPFLKYEIIGILCICLGLFATVGFVGVDTGRLGYTVDDILAYIFGTGRVVVSLALMALGLKFIVVRQACPVSGAWGLGAWIYVLALGLLHLVMIPEGAEFLPRSLSLGGGIIGALIASLLHQLLGYFGAVLAILAGALIPLLVWKNWSLAGPVSAMTDKAGEEAAKVSAKVSDKAVEGLQDASQSLKKWHHGQQQKHIFDQQAVEAKEKQSLPRPKKGEGYAVYDLGNGVEEIHLQAAAKKENPADGVYDWAQDESFGPDEEQKTAQAGPAEKERADETPLASPLPQIQETIAADTQPTAHDVQPKAVPQTDVLKQDMQDLKPIEVEKSSVAADVSDEGSSAVPKAIGEKTYRLPPVTLLKPGPQHQAGLSEEVRENARILQETLQSFNIDAKILNASQGPSVTRYELEPAAGVKVSKIVHLADDIALKLAATDIRIEAPIPGKAAVGIEVPNKKLTGVNLRDVLDTDAFQKASGGVPVCLGKDIAGQPIVADLTKMPHLLVAGSTGSGKSVCINTFIASILFKQRPEDVKLILVDPKVVELSNYNGIPHLLTPVVTDPKKAASVLRWAVREMDDRYKRFAQTKTRDIARYNELHPEDAMPFIVIIIDELADLMMTASDDVEKSIIRLGQKARACGMHLVLATQRPSVDVLTGLIKANVPSRIAFAVSSQVDSRTIIDMAGAEKLIGKGDMLFYPLGAAKPLRVQGAFISDAEIDALVEFVKAQGGPHYDEAVEKAQSENPADQVDFFEDELMPQALDMVLESGQVSTSLLQRRFRIGYTRAARMVDMMEAMHIVGPSNGTKPREVIMSPEEVQAKYLS